MGVPIQDKVCLLMAWALLLMCTTAEQEYFIQPENLSWDQARNYCQFCFQDLVTLTPYNIQKISSRLNSEHWIGLRKNFNSTNNSTSNSSSDSGVSWTKWSNEDPLTFQNWHPGRPVPKYPLPKIECCSCSCTCPANLTSSIMTLSKSANTTDTSYENTPDLGILFLDQNGTNITEFGNFTTESTTSYGGHTGTTESPGTTTGPTPLEATCERSPAALPVVAEINKDYIEDPCVAMLSFGPWIEKSCLEMLPFICYEDRFFGHINVTKVTLESATLTWLVAPGDISHYRVELNDGVDLMENLTDLSRKLDNLTAGTLYDVKVFPVKCGRDLNPQNRSFYTIPHKVKDLRVIAVHEKNVSLEWDKPDGNVDFYLLKSDRDDDSFEVKNEMKDIDGLIPGGCYTFTISSGVQDKSRWSEETSIPVCTKPGKVSNLKASNNTENSLLLSWTLPEGNVTGFNVKAVSSYDNNVVWFKTLTQAVDQVQVTELPVGQEIRLNVTALANHSIEGESVEIVDYTVPGPVSNLTLRTEHSSLSATWDASSGNYSNFSVELLLDGRNEQTETTRNTYLEFKDLKTAAYYTVVVCAVSGHLKGPAINNSDYTLPNPPTDVRGFNATTNSITFEWTPPQNIGTADYLVNLTSSFWKQNWSRTVRSKTSYTFHNLTSGTSYDFKVSTLAGKEESKPVKCSHSTDPDKREITLSMLCSSQEILLCDKTDTRHSVLKELKNHFLKELGNSVFWELYEHEIEKT